MDLLPSYQEAIAKSDWLNLVAPYCNFDDYRALCLVNRRFQQVFAPRLWRDLLNSVRLAGVDPGDDLTWWLNFVFNKLSQVGDATRSLVRILDARRFAKESYGFSIDQHERTLTGSLRQALALLPEVDTMLFDGHTDIDHAALIGSQSSTLGLARLRMLSLKDCSCQLPSTFFNATHLQTLVYLDVSNLPGSISTILQPAVLPALRILKVAGRELDNSAFRSLIAQFRLRLWSLDVTDNKLSDDVIQSFRDCCLPPSTLRTSEHMQVEGTIVAESGGTQEYGPFLSIRESELSASFCHPERYYVDAPAYVGNPDMPLQDYHPHRLDGSSPVRKDGVDAVKDILSENPNYQRGDDHIPYSGITHLRLSYTHISAQGIQKLLRISDGHMEDFACDSMPLLPRSGGYFRAWPRNASLNGILGAADSFRPVFSSNLRALRIHHSLVTNIPSLQIEGMSSMACLFLAETVILHRVEIAYPQTFTPDTNPRLTSLTLTCLPRRSSGPLISRLFHFMKLLSSQERGIQDAPTTPLTRHSPRILQGLRHLRLEFEPDPAENGLYAPESLDPEELMNSGERVFSFFDNEWVEESPSSNTSKSCAKPRKNSRGVAEGLSVTTMDQASGPDQDNSQYVTYDAEWNGEPFSIQVWVGPNDNDSPGVLKDYRRLVLEHHVRDGVGPASASQIQAGAPSRSFVFHVAWSAAVMPFELTSPTSVELGKMRDVLDALKTYRLTGRAKYLQYKKLALESSQTVRLGDPHNFWTGRLEVSTEATPHLSRPSQYWR